MEPYGRGHRYGAGRTTGEDMKFLAYVRSLAAHFFGWCGFGDGLDWFARHLDSRTTRFVRYSFDAAARGVSWFADK